MIATVVLAKHTHSEENHSLRKYILKYTMHQENHLFSPNNCCYMNGRYQYGYLKHLQ